MIGYTYGFNSAVFQIIVRMEVLGSTFGINPAVLIPLNKRIWVAGLSRKSIESLNKVPVSLYRFRFQKNIFSDSMPNDDRMIRSTLNLALVSEAVNYLKSSEYDPVLASGSSAKTYKWFTGLTYRQRIRICDNESFGITIPCNTSRLALDGSKESALLNTCHILSADYTEFDLKSNGKYQGDIEDFGLQPHQTYDQMRNMIEQGLRPLIASALTGIDTTVVSNYARSNQVRRGETRQAIKGRIPSVEVSYSRNRAQSNLFMLIYQLIGANTKTTINSRAALYAYKQTCLFLKHMGYKSDEIININDAFNIAIGQLSGEVMWRVCTKCGIREAFVPAKPGPCYACDS